MTSNLASRMILALMVFLCGAISARAHDVPGQITVYAFVKPQNDTLTMLVRVPMIAMRDSDIPVRPDGNLDLAAIDTPIRHAAELWIENAVVLTEDGMPLDDPAVLGVRVALGSDRSFSDYDGALAGIEGPPLPDGTAARWEQSFLDVAYAYTIRSATSSFAIDPDFRRLGVDVNVVLRFLPPDKPERAFNVAADIGLVTLDPGIWQTLRMFGEEGFFHILGGIDHLLFLLALVLPFRRLRPLVVIVTAFTVGHSITLGAAAFGLAPDALWFPFLIETLIALSILYMALENIVGAELGRRWWIAFAFGLVHGFGFSFLLQEQMQFAGQNLVGALLAFNVGVELGQLMMLLVFVGGLSLLFRHVDQRIGIVIASALVAHTAWHWMTERGGNLLEFPWPTMDAAAWSEALWWATAAAAVAVILWLVSGVVRRIQTPGSHTAPGE